MDVIAHRIFLVRSRNVFDAKQVGNEHLPFSIFMIAAYLFK